MADPTTVLDYATQRSETAKTAVADAQQRLAKAQTATTAKRDELTRATTAFSDLEKTAAEIRKKLGVIPTPVDGPKLLYDLEQAIIGSRAQQAAILKAGSDLRAAQLNADQAQAELAAASPSRAKADSDLLQATKSDSLRKGWKNALATPPLVTIKDDAANELKLEPFTKAKTRVESELPKILRDRAVARREAKADRFAKALTSVRLAEDRLLTEREKTGASAMVESARIRLLRAEAAAKDFVNNAKSRFDQAQTLLTQVSDQLRAPLTPEQIAALTDATLKDARAEAAAAEKALDDLWKKVEARQALLDQAKLDDIVIPNKPAVEEAAHLLDLAIVDFTTANNIWRAEFQGLEKKKELEGKVEEKKAKLAQALADANNDPAVQAVVDAQKDLDTAEEDLRIAKAPYHRILLDDWEAAAPDATWRLLDDFEKARAVLTMLSGSNPSTLATDLTDAETRYVKALLAADASAALLTQLVTEQARRATLQQSALQTESDSLFSALRGDY